MKSFFRVREVHLVIPSSSHAAQAGCQRTPSLPVTIGSFAGPTMWQRTQAPGGFGGDAGRGGGCAVPGVDARGRGEARAAPGPGGGGGRWGSLRSGVARAVFVL